MPGLDPAFHRRADDRTGAMVQLLLGNMGMPGGGSTRCAGTQHPGLTDIGLLSNLLTGYMTLPAAGA